MGVIDGRVAIITGGARGIGASISRLFAQEGASLVINDLGGAPDGSGGDEGPAKQIADEIVAAGGSAVSDGGDIGNVATGERLVGTAVEQFGKLDIVVNVAGILRDRMIFNLAEQDWDEVIRVHLKGHYSTVRPASAYWREQRNPQGHYRVINFTSVSGLDGSPGQPNYAAAKMGIVGLTYSLAQGLARYGVTANAIAPGAATRLTATVPADKRVRARRAALGGGPADVTGQHRAGRAVPGERAVRLADRPGDLLGRVRGRPVREPADHQAAQRPGAVGVRPARQRDRGQLPAGRQRAAAQPLRQPARHQLTHHRDEAVMDILEGMQVVDLSHGIAGPVVGMFLADFGAEVIKVEPPAGDPARSLPGFAAWNRGKKGVIADPADPGRRRWLAELIAGADVCLVSDAGTLAGYGLDRWRLLRDSPRLVLVETPAYAGDAPWHGGAESHGLLAAALGVAWRQSSHDGGPVESVARFLLQVHGVWATVCAVAALVERERSGFGQLVSVSGVNAVMEANIGSFSVDPSLPDPPTGIGPGGRHPTYTRFVARDGKWLASGALGAKFETALLGILGLSWMLREERMGGRVQNLVRPDNILWANELTSAAFLARDRDEWLELMTGLGIPCGPLGGRDRWLDHEQVRAIGMRAEVDDPERGRVVMPGVPVNLTGAPGRVRGPAPALGQHEGTVAPRAPKAAPDGLPPVSEGPLSGIRVLDMGTFVAGPTPARCSPSSARTSSRWSRRALTRSASPGSCSTAACEACR